METVNRAAFFDVDGTLVKGQTQEILLRNFYSLGLISTSQLLKAASWFLLHRLSIVKSSLEIRKELYKAFTHGSKAEIDRICLHSFEESIKPNIDFSMQPYVDKHLKMGYFVAAISGTLDVLCGLVCRELGMQRYFATVLEEQRGCYTGRWKGEVLEGEAKATFIQHIANEKGLDLSQSYAYADNMADLPLLHSVGHPVVVSKDWKIIRYARKAGWEVIGDAT